MAQLGKVKSLVRSQTTKIWKRFAVEGTKQNQISDTNIRGWVRYHHRRQGQGHSVRDLTDDTEQAKCPAMQCNRKCNKPDHFEVCCRTKCTNRHNKTVHEVPVNQSTESTVQCACGYDESFHGTLILISVEAMLL